MGGERRPHLEKNLHSPEQGKSLAAGTHGCSCWNDLLKLAHPTAYGGSKSHLCCTVRGTGHVSCLHPGMAAECDAGCAPRGAQGHPSKRAHSALQPRGLRAAAGSLSAAMVSTPPALGAPNSSAGKSCAWKKLLPAGEGPSALKRVLLWSGLLTAPDHPQLVPRGLFKGKVKAGVT